MTDRELAGCPCCRKPAHFSDEYQNADGEWAVECSACNLLSWTVEDWNRRTPSSEGDGRDAERLDWVQSVFEKSHSSISFRHYARGCMGCEIFTVPSQHVRGYGVRGAIDAAIAAAARSQGTDPPE